MFLFLQSVHADHDPDRSKNDDEYDHRGGNHLSDLPFTFSFGHVHEHEQLDRCLNECKDEYEGNHDIVCKTCV